jgi:N-carbamoyl-L-amino-acid hydrolase
LLSAARFIEKVNQVVIGMPGRQVGTVGWIRVQPGAYNVIPGKTVLGLELRDLDANKVETMFNRIRDEAKQIGALNNTSFSFSEPIVTHPALTDQGIQKLIDATAKELGFSTRVMPSGAGHDAQEMAVIGPVGMIFIPSIGGISHSPREFSTPSDIESGANVLLQAVMKFDGSTPKPL